MSSSHGLMSLTGLPDRSSCLARAGTLAALPPADAGTLAVLWLDIDRFQAINRALGHAGGDQVMLHRSGDTIYAVRNRCTHQGAPLDRGPVKIGGSEATVTCPFHGSTFRLGDGGVMRGPAVEPVQATVTFVGTPDKTGARMSCTVMTWRAFTGLPQSSVADQDRLMV